MRSAAYEASLLRKSLGSDQWPRSRLAREAHGRRTIRPEFQLYAVEIVVWHRKPSGFSKLRRCFGTRHTALGSKCSVQVTSQSAYRQLLCPPEIEFNVPGQRGAELALEDE